MSYFTISEMLRSETAIRRRIWNGAGQEEEDNLRALIAAVLDPVRRQFGAPIKVTSGFRCKEVNKSVGGVTGSQHLVGEAADIISSSNKKAENYVIGRLIVALGNYDQVIFENVGPNDLRPEWIHVSWKRKGANRQNILKKIKGSNRYDLVTKKQLGLC